MSKRIDELYLETIKRASGTQWDPRKDFAELIVKKCISLAEDTSELDPADNIREYFGYKNDR